MAWQESRARRWILLAAWPVGLLLFVLALFSTGAGHGSYWAVIVFYPLQFLAGGLPHLVWRFAGSDELYLAITAILSLPWYPLLAYLLTSGKRAFLGIAIGLLVLQAVGGVVIARNL